jgi:membrane protein
MRNRLASLTIRVLRELKDDDATHLAAGVAFYTVFSLIPLLIVLFWFANLIFPSDAQYENLLELFFDNIPGFSEVISNNFEDETRFGSQFGVIGLIGLVWLSSSVFGAVSHAVNRAWDIYDDRPIYLTKPLHVLMALTICGLMFISVIASSAIELFLDPNYVLAMSEYKSVQPELQFEIGFSKIALSIFPWITTLILFLLIYRFIPNCKTFWKYIWPGAVVASILFESGKYVFLWYVNNLATYDQIYGSLSSVIVLMSWIYFSAFVIIVGAEVSSEYGRMKSNLPRGSIKWEL